MSYQGMGFSIVEMFSRSPEYYAIIDEANANLKSLLSIPENYVILWQHGGAYQQFSAVPFNLGKKEAGTHLVSGFWS